MAKTKTKSAKRSTPIYPRAFRYRSNGTESNRKVLVTAQNQNSLRGFDVSEMTTRQIVALEKTWSKVQNLNIPLADKESKAISSSRNAKNSFKTFKQSRVRYFLKNS
tara:strand:+ start:181 stop:501 length:321 start_codon:yes stop_codon:yes gene_type:complete